MASNQQGSIRSRLGRRGLMGSSVALAASLGLLTFQTMGHAAPTLPALPSAATATPIQHLVVIFQENISFDHYFGTYPKAANTSGESFFAGPGTPKVNDLADTPGVGGTGTLLTNNPNTTGTVQVNPRRYDPANVNDVLTCDQDHDYNDEQSAFDGGAMDKFVQSVGTHAGKSPEGSPCQATDVMNYYDGNTVQGMWNYAQNFAMSDNSFGTTYGPSAPGAINLVSGDTGNVGTMINGAATNGDVVADGKGGFTLVSDAQPYYDDCSTRAAVSLKGTNIGDELNAAGVSWGWFQGGFSPSTSFSAAANAIGATTSTASFTPDEFKNSEPLPPNASSQGLCNTVHPVGAAVGGDGQYGYKDDYIAHHEPFQYYASTANPHHLAPASLAAIGTDTQGYVGGTPQFNTANHNYDTSDFDALVGAITRGYLPASNLPAVSFIKAPGYQDGHAAYSDPYDEQVFVTHVINELEASPDWSSTAVVISYDDSDGWYDHVFNGVTNASNTQGATTPTIDELNGSGVCGNTTANPPLGGENGRCGYGPRIPLLVVSPYAKHNFVDHTVTDQSSISRFVETNWKLTPQDPNSFMTIAGSLDNLFNFSGGDNPALFLDPLTGKPDPAPGDNQ